MTSHRREVNVPTPPAPEELAATDALLDRLAARAPDEADLRDPIAAALAELAADVDLPTVVVRSEQTAADDVAAHDAQLSRLLGVLGDRPLFVLDDAERTDTLQDAELGAPPDIVVLDDPSWHPGTSDVVIDLRDAASRPAALDEGDPVDDVEPEVEGADDTTDEDSAPTVPVHVLAPVPDVTPDSASPPVPPAQRRPGGARVIPMPVARWAESRSINAETLQRAARHVPLSIAATIAVFTVASGVTAAVTGDPLAPITGVTNVIDQLSGDDDAMLVAVQHDIVQAKAKTTARDFPAAQKLLRQATSKLDEVPAGQKPRLKEQIVKVQASIAAGVASPTTPPPPSVVPPPVPTVTPTPTITPSAPTPTPTDEPSVTETPTDPDPEPTEPSTPASTTAPAVKPPVVVKPTVTKTLAKVRPPKTP